MNIFITGATGFLGSKVVRHCIAQGFFVIGVIRDKSDTSRITDVFFHKNFKSINPENIQKVLEEDKIDIIIHTATSYGRKGETFEDMKKVNVEFPLTLLELGKKYDLKAFINSDTFSELIGKDQQNYEYVLTKKEFLKQGKEAAAHSSIKFINMIIEQMYGPEDNPTKFIPNLIKKFLSNKEQISLNPGLQKRDYVFVDDVAEAFVKACLHLDALGQFEEFGMGTGTTHTLQELALTIKKTTGSTSIPNFGDVPYHPHEVMSSVAYIENNIKIEWKAETTLEKGIGGTVEFYKKYPQIN